VKRTGRSRLAWLPAIALCLCACGIATAATLAEKEQAMARQACLGPAEQVAQGDADGEFLVVCPAHTTLAGRAALFVAQCRHDAPRCDRPALAIRVPVGTHSALLWPRGASFGRTDEIARMLVDYPWHFNGRDLAAMLQGLCLVEDQGSGAFAGARDYLVRCGQRGVVVTRACAGEACRLFPARWEDETQAAAATGVRIR